MHYSELGVQAAKEFVKRIVPEAHYDDCGPGEGHFIMADEDVVLGWVLGHTYDAAWLDAAVSILKFIAYPLCSLQELNLNEKTADFLRNKLDNHRNTCS